MKVAVREQKNSGQNKQKTPLTFAKWKRAEMAYEKKLNSSMLKWGLMQRRQWFLGLRDKMPVGAMTKTCELDFTQSTHSVSEL